MWNWEVRGDKNIEDSDSESLDWLEQTVSGIMEVNDSANQDVEGCEEHGRENLNHLRECLNHRLLVEIWKLNVLLLGAQKEMRNT